MVDQGVGLAVTFAALALFALVGVVGALRFGVRERDPYLTARGTQGASALALSFFASALGTWILFAPPEVGTFGGFLGIFGYALGQAAAIAVFAVLGPMMRDRLPVGSTILEFVRLRFGRIKQLYVGGISVFYMFIFLTAELTAIGLVSNLVAGVGPTVPIVAVAAVTAAYTAYGGLPASLATDRWQGWIILGLVGAAAAAVAVDVPAPAASLRAGGIGELSRTGVDLFVVLVIAIIAANLFHQGFWQRVWAARDRASLVRGALAGGWLILPVVFLTGAAGALAAGAGLAEVPSLAFFDLLRGLPEVVIALVVALGVALVASTTDTLQNALTSLVAAHVGGGRLSLASARVVTVLLTVPAAAIAVEGLSVLRLFLIADLLAATVVFPVFLGFWRRATTMGALAGAVAGLAAVVGVGWGAEGGPGDGFRLLSLPPDLVHLQVWAFVAAVAASAAVAVLGSRVSAERPTRSPPGGPEAGR